LTNCSSCCFVCALTDAENVTTVTTSSNHVPIRESFTTKANKSLPPLRQWVR
jgi:hypothetical protein